ncbi:MAG TPA: flagellar hook-basal body complex protein [Solirubrobacteraceae bacterium]|jgi:flagellar hook protein FlgE|nr:flagellar hook-basal body complex protein [Solirubrobacteraceae bacterium]
MYAAISGLDANQAMMNLTANDLANVNTVGYKSANMTFADELTQISRGASGPTATNGGTNPVQVGLGTQINSTRNEMTEGSFQSTGNPLDVAIEGTGFLRVGAGEAPAKPPYTTGLPADVDYTRAGDLTTNSKGYLTTEAGDYVVGRNAVVTEVEGGNTYAPGEEDSYLVIPPGSTNISIGQDGSIGYTDNDPESKTYQQHVIAGYLSLATFANEDGLERLGGSLWAKTANSGEAIVGTPSTVGYGSTIGGVLEMSNVDLATEMTTMITAERGFQANSRTITVADQMLQTLVTMVN